MFIDMYLDLCCANMEKSSHEQIIIVEDQYHILFIFYLYQIWIPPEVSNFCFIIWQDRATWQIITYLFEVQCKFMFFSLTNIDVLVV